MRAQQRKDHWELKLDLDEQMSVEVFEHIQEALEVWNSWQHFEKKFPQAGGYMDQEVWWTEALVCVQTAYNLADQERRKKTKPKTENDFSNFE